MPELKRVRELGSRVPQRDDFLLTDPAVGAWGRSSIREVIGNAAFVHNQPSAALTWTINHNLGYYPSVTVLSTGLQELIANVSHPTLNQTVIQFGMPFAGMARLS